MRKLFLCLFATVALGSAGLAVYAVGHPAHLCEHFGPKQCSCCPDCKVCDKDCKCEGKCQCCDKKPCTCKPKK